MYYFDTQTLTQNVHASRRIHAGEEITITYIEPLQTLEKRLAATKRSWGFECTCSLCTQSAEKTRESDKRIRKIVQLIESLKKPEDGTESADIKAKAQSLPSPAMAELLISLYEQERLYATIFDAYVLAARAYSSVADQYTALKYAYKAIEVGLINSGPRDKDVHDMKALVKAPGRHWSWGVRLLGNVDEL